jgi:hypothetical protein
VFITAGPSTKLFAWGGGIWEDMCYERRRADALVCVCLLLQDLVQSCLRGGGGDMGGHVIVPVCVFVTAGPSTKLFAWGGGGYGRTCATRDDEPRPVWTRLPITIEVDPQRCGLGSCQSDFALQAVVECRALETERVRLVALR